MTAPLVPPEVNLRGLPWMRLDTTRLLDSDLFALSTGDEFKAAVALWCKSWTQQPAASLPDDDRVLAHLSGAGSRWKKVKAMALRGWAVADDGRYYHPVVAEQALAAWEERQEYRAEVDSRNERKRRERDERKAMFEQLKAAGYDLAWNTPTGQLRDMARDLSRQSVTQSSHTGHGDSHGLDGTGRDGNLKALTPDGPLSAEGSLRARAQSDQQPDDDPAVAETPAPAPATATIEPTATGRACRAMRRGGLATTNPSDPRLAAAIAEGGTDAMFEATAAEACSHDPPKGAPWVIATIRGRIADAARQSTTGALHGPHRQQPRPSAVDRVVANIQRAREADQQRADDGADDAIPGQAVRLPR